MSLSSLYLKKDVHARSCIHVLCYVNSHILVSLAMVDNGIIK